MSIERIPEEEIGALAKKMLIFSLQAEPFARAIETATIKRVHEQVRIELAEMMAKIVAASRSTTELNAAATKLFDELAAIASEVEENARHASYYLYLRDKHQRVAYTTDVEGRTPEARMLDGIRKAGVVNTDLIRIDLPCYHLGPTEEPIWKDGEHFDYAANMDASIAAAISKGTTR